jgi:hypothetical protein
MSTLMENETQIEALRSANPNLDTQSQEEGLEVFALSSRSEQNIEFLDDVPFDMGDWIRDYSESNEWCIKTLKLWFAL